MHLLDRPTRRLIHQDISPAMQKHISPALDVKQIYTEEIKEFTYNFENFETESSSNQLFQYPPNMRSNVLEEAKQRHEKRSLDVRIGSKSVLKVV